MELPPAETSIAHRRRDDASHADNQKQTKNSERDTESALHLQGRERHRRNRNRRRLLPARARDLEPHLPGARAIIHRLPVKKAGSVGERVIGSDVGGCFEASPVIGSGVMWMPLTFAPLDRTSRVATPGITVGMRMVT